MPPGFDLFTPCLVFFLSSSSSFLSVYSMPPGSDLFTVCLLVLICLLHASWFGSLSFFFLSFFLFLFSSSSFSF